MQVLDAKKGFWACMLIAGDWQRLNVQDRCGVVGMDSAGKRGGWWWAGDMTNRNVTPSIASGPLSVVTQLKGV